jgi:hypothetical protein
VCQWEFLRRDVLQELIALVDDFDVDAIAVAVGYQGSQMPNVTAPLLSTAARLAASSWPLLITPSIERATASN